MRRLMSNARIRCFLSAQEGTTAIEYSIIAAGIAGVLIAVVSSIGGSVAGMWNSAAGIF